MNVVLQGIILITLTAELSPGV